MSTMVPGLQRIGVIEVKRIGLMVLVIAVLVLSACSAEVLTLDVGTCFDDPEAFDLVDSSDVPIVECDVPHDNEVYANKDLQDSCNRDELPVALVAISDGEVCGTAALKAESVSTHKHLTPWLAALLVAPGFRRRGVGERLIAAIEEKAKQLGFHCIYVGTGEGSGTPESSLRKRGWEFVEKSPYFVSEVSIFQKAL